MTDNKECNPKEHDWMYDEGKEYRICWKCRQKQHLEWRVFDR